MFSRLSSRFAVADDGPLLRLGELWRQQREKINLAYAAAEPADLADRISLPLYRQLDAIEVEIADLPARTRRGLAAKAQIIGELLDDAGYLCCITESQSAVLRSLADDAASL
jgi:hypothetical protein